MSAYAPFPAGAGVWKSGTNLGIKGGYLTFTFGERIMCSSPGRHISTRSVALTIADKIPILSSALRLDSLLCLPGPATERSANL